jgi:hypothetical protein
MRAALNTLHFNRSRSPNRGAVAERLRGLSSQVSLKLIHRLKPLRPCEATSPVSGGKSF